MVMYPLSPQRYFKYLNILAVNANIMHNPFVIVLASALENLLLLSSEHFHHNYIHILHTCDYYGDFPPILQQNLYLTARGPLLYNVSSTTICMSIILCMCDVNIKSPPFRCRLTFLLFTQPSRP